MGRCKRKDCVYKNNVPGDMWCSYANEKAGRETLLKTVCDLHGIPYSDSKTLGIKALREYSCPCYKPRKKGASK